MKRRGHLFVMVLQWDQYDKVYDIDWDFSNLEVCIYVTPLYSD